MTEMIFFSKTGCQKSEKKKDLLERAGNSLSCRDLVSQDWTREKLLPFVRGRGPLDILDMTAPDIQLGRIDPLLLTFEQTLELLIKDPVLIKGPLVQVENLHLQGPDDSRLKRYMVNQADGSNTTSWKNRQRTGEGSSLPWHQFNSTEFAVSYSYA